MSSAWKEYKSSFKALSVNPFQVVGNRSFHCILFYKTSYSHPCTTHTQTTGFSVWGVAPTSKYRLQITHICIQFTVWTNPHCGGNTPSFVNVVSFQDKPPKTATRRMLDIFLTWALLTFPKAFFRGGVGASVEVEVPPLPNFVFSHTCTLFFFGLAVVVVSESPWGAAGQVAVRRTNFIVTAVTAKAAAYASVTISVTLADHWTCY